VIDGATDVPQGVVGRTESVIPATEIHIHWFAIHCFSMPLHIKMLDELVHCVGDAHVLLGSSVTARATHFWNAEPRQAGAIVRPANTEELSQVLSICHAGRQRIVTHGGLTGLVDGDRTSHDDLVVSLERMRHIESIDTVGKTMTVQAGCVLENVQQYAREHHLDFGLDLGARGSCTIGGNIATNAGGLSVLRHGMMREQVLGLEVVLMDGTIMSSMNAMLKNNAGHDLKHLFIGTEGTLGVITRAVLRLRAETNSVNTAFLSCERFDDVNNILAHLDRDLSGQLNAFEVLWKPVVELNTNPELHGTVAAPISTASPYYVLAEARGAHPDSDAARFEQVIGECFENGWANDGVIAQSSQEQQKLWTIRENIELMLEHEPNYVFDISLPIESMDEYVATLDTRLQSLWPGTRLFSYGHVADGNLHIIVAPPKPDDEQASSQYEQVNKLVYGPLTDLGGSISAEHGIGFSKKPWLNYTRSDVEINIMRSVKKTFDPLNLLNTGRIVDPC